MTLMLKRQTVTTLLELLGMTLLVAAAWCVDYRLGLVAAGAALLAVGILMERR